MQTCDTQNGGWEESEGHHMSWISKRYVNSQPKKLQRRLNSKIGFYHD